MPSQYLADILRRILKENSKKLPPSTRYGYGSKNGSFICKHRYVCNIEAEIIYKSPHKPLVWKRFIDDIFSLLNIDKEEIYSFIELANNHHPTIKFAAEVSDTETFFLDTY